MYELSEFKISHKLCNDLFVIELDLFIFNNEVKYTVRILIRK